MFASSICMPDAKRIRIYYEGNDDRAALEGLLSCGLLDASWEITKRKASGGRDGVIEELAPFIRPVDGVGGHAIVLLDLDDLDPAALHGWFLGKLTDALKPHMIEVASHAAPAPARWRLVELKADSHIGRVVVVPVGLPGDAELVGAHPHLERFAVDDHFLKLARDPTCYASVSEFKSVEHAKALRLMNEVADLLQRNGVEIRNSKRYLYLLRAIADVRAGSATLIERLISCASKSVGPVRVQQFFAPLVEDLRDAAQALGDTGRR